VLLKTSVAKTNSGENRDAEVAPTLSFLRLATVLGCCTAFLLASLTVANAVMPVKPATTITCALPDDHLIWPVPTGAAEVIVETKFDSMQELLRIRRGNHFEITTRVVYKVSGAKSEFPHDEISFIFRDYRATPESGIMEKRVGNPFGPGTARFWLDKPEHGGVWGIQSYEVNRKLEG